MSVIAIIGGLALACAIGWLLKRRAGVLQALPAGGDADGSTEADATFLGLDPGVPTVVHFSAPWCGPCAGLRRVVDAVCSDLQVAHREVDIDADPAAARRFSVLSLPTTLIFDGDGRQRYRASGVPSAADLRAALEPLLA